MFVCLYIRFHNICAVSSHTSCDAVPKDGNDTVDLILPQLSVTTTRMATCPWANRATVIGSARADTPGCSAAPPCWCSTADHCDASCPPLKTAKCRPHSHLCRMSWNRTENKTSQIRLLDPAAPNRERVLRSPSTCQQVLCLFLWGTGPGIKTTLDFGKFKCISFHAVLSSVFGAPLVPQQSVWRCFKLQTVSKRFEIPHLVTVREGPQPIYLMPLKFNLIMNVNEGFMHAARFVQKWQFHTWSRSVWVVTSRGGACGILPHYYAVSVWTFIAMRTQLTGCFVSGILWTPHFLPFVLESYIQPCAHKKFTICSLRSFFFLAL